MSEKLIELLRKRVKQTREWQQSETMTAALSDLDLAEIAVVERLDALESSLAQAQAELDNAWGKLPGLPGGTAPDGQPMDIPETTLADEIRLLLERFTQALADVEALRVELLVILDQVDYTAGNCEVTEMVGAVLPRQIIARARERLAALPLRVARMEQPADPTSDNGT